MYGLLILNFVIPFVMIFVGYILKKHPVKFDYQSECHCSKTVRAKSSLRRRRTFWPIG